MEYDVLRAAQDQAYWAAWTAVVAVLGLVTLPLNAAGLWFVWRQLRLNARATELAIANAEDARRAVDVAVQSNRPWVRILAEPEGEFIVAGAQRYFSVFFRLENVGSMVALQVSASCRHVPALWSTGYLEQHVQGNLPHIVPTTIYPGQVSMLYERWVRVVDETINIASIDISYLDPTTNIERRTIQLFWLMKGWMREPDLVRHAPELIVNGAIT